MDKYEFNIKVEQIKKLVGKSDYETAMKIADTIDWRRVRNTNLLSMVAMVYEKNEDYEEAREILLLAYERAPIGKRLLYKLAELAIKEGNIDEAEAYYREFSDLAGDDPRQQLLRYLILKEKGAPAQQLIHSLESYTSAELDERWLYELAELYSMAGMTDRCVETCDRIMLMFGLGKYVEKAMDLKTRYAPLSNYQRDLVENRDKYEAKLRAVEQEYGIGGRGSIQEPEDGYYEDDNMQGQPGYYENGNMSGQPGYYENENMPLQSGYYENENVPMQPGYYEDVNAPMQPGYYENVNAPMPLGYYEDENVPMQPGYYEDVNAPMQPGYYEDENVPQQPGYYEDDNMPGYQGVGDAAEQSGFYEEDGVPEESEYFKEDQIPEEPDYYEDEIAASLEEAAVQEKLAREMSKISYQEPVSRPASEMEHTRVLDDIRRVGHPAEWSSGAAGAAAAETAAASLAGNLRAAGSVGRLASAMPRPHGVVRIPAVDEEMADMTDEPVVEEETAAEAPIGGNTGAETYRDDYSDEYDGLMKKTESYPEADKEVSAEYNAEEWPEVEDMDEEEQETDLPVLNHLMIEARTPEKGLKTAIDALKQIHRETGVKNPVARITGSKLSKRGVLASAEKLAGKDLVIEEAGDMTAEAINELNELMSRDSSGMVVVLIDNPKQMEKLHQEQPTLASKFECIGTGEAPVETKIPEETKNKAAVTPLYKEEEFHKEDAYQRDSYAPLQPEDDAYIDERSETDSYEDEPYDDANPQKEKKSGFWKRKKPVYEEMEPEDSYEDDDYYVEETEVRDEASPDDGPGSHGEEMDIDEFAQYACRYANEIDCSITGKSMLALYERIEIMEEDGVPLTRGNAAELIEEAADRAEKPSFGKRIKGIFSSKYDKDGLLILKEEHFIY